MRMLSRKFIEAIGDRVFAAYKKLPDVQGSPICRVDPELLATKLLGLKVAYQRLSLDESILGITSSDAVDYWVYDEQDDPVPFRLDGATILVEKALARNARKMGRCHFTLAHEISHQIYKLLYPQEYGAPLAQPGLLFYRPDSGSKGKMKDWTEWQADTLASAILMRQELVLETLRRVRLPNGIGRLNPVWNHRDYLRFSDAAELLGVSQDALALRLKRMGLFGADERKNPYAGIDITCEGEEP